MKYRIIKKSILTFLILSFGDFAQGGTPTRRELGIAETLSLVEKTNPGLKASAARESQSNANVSIAQSYLYPSFHLDAADSFGFPGSSIPTPAQFGGLMNSPFRVGPTVGVLGKVTLLDLGNWY